MIIMIKVVSDGSACKFVVSQPRLKVGEIIIIDIRVSTGSNQHFKPFGWVSLFQVFTELNILLAFRNSRCSYNFNAEISARRIFFVVHVTMLQNWLDHVQSPHDKWENKQSRMSTIWRKITVCLSLQSNNKL